MKPHCGQRRQTFSTDLRLRNENEMGRPLPGCYVYRDVIRIEGNHPLRALLMVARLEDRGALGEGALA